MKIQLKNIKHSEFASQETYCYQASVYFDGKKAGTVGNEGHGGCDHQQPENNTVWNLMTDYIDAMPSKENDIGDDIKFTMKSDLESICCELINDFLTTRDMKRLLKNRVLYVQDGALYQTKCVKNPSTTLPNWILQISERKNVEMVLNTMNQGDALIAYRKYTP